LPKQVLDSSITAQAVNPNKNGDWDYGLGIRGRTVSGYNRFYYLAVNGNGSWEFDAGLNPGDKIC